MIIVFIKRFVLIIISIKLKYFFFTDMKALNVIGHVTEKRSA